MNPAEERRQTPRVAISFRVKVETPRGTFQGTGRDLSEGGLSVFLKNSPPLKSAVEISFQLPGSGRPVRVTGEVMHQQREAAGSEGWVGIRFLRMDLDSQQAIRNFIKSAAAIPPAAVPPPLPRG